MNKITVTDFIRLVVAATKKEIVSRFHIKESEERNIIFLRIDNGNVQKLIKVPESIPAEHFAENKYEYLLGALGDALDSNYEISVLRHYSGLKEGYMLIDNKVIVTFKYLSK